MEINDKKLIRAFISKTKKTKKRFMELLLKCSTLENQEPSTILRSAINALSNTIASLTEGTKTLDDIKRYNINVSICKEEDMPPLMISLIIEQKKSSHPLPLNHFIEISVPLNDKAHTKPIKKVGTITRFEHVFVFSERSDEIIEQLVASDVQFTLYKKSSLLGNEKIVPIAIATAPISPLVYSTSSSIPLNFMMLDGVKTRFSFDCIMNVEFPLVTTSELMVNETIDVIPDETLKNPTM